VKEKFAFSIIKTMLHTSVVAAPSTSTTIARLADLLISVEARRFGLVVDHIQILRSFRESSPHRFFTDDLNGGARVSRNSSLIAAVVKNASGG